MRVSRFPADRSNGGFSLVELAIAVTVIGLLLAGLIKGNELIDNARTNRVVMDFNNVQSAMKNFQRTYSALPGDMRNAADRIPNCTAAPCDGNGNGDLQIHTSPNNNSNPFNNTSYPSASEMRAFWVQLARVGMMDKINANYTGAPNTSGVDFPATPFGGGYRVFNTAIWLGTGPSASTFPRIRENVIRPSAELGSSPSAASKMFTARQAAQIDRKLDDGLPMTGRVLGLGSSGSACVASSDDVYAESASPQAHNGKCNILYVLGR